MRYFLMTALFLWIQSFVCYGKDVDSTHFISKFRFGLYVMPNIVISPNEAIRKHTKDGGKILGKGIMHGLHVEFKLSDRRSLRSGIFLSEARGRAQIKNDEPTLPYSPNNPGYFLTVNENYLEFPIAFKYTFIKSEKKSKINPYLLIGLSNVFLYRKESIYENNGGTIYTTHTEVDNLFLHSNQYINLTVGLNAYITRKINIYFEPFYNIAGNYLGYSLYSFGIHQCKWSLGMGVNYKLIR